MASELSKFIDDELQKVDTAEERERLISKLRVRTTARDASGLSRAGPSWQEQLLPRKRLLIIGLCVFLLVAVAAVAVGKGSSSGKGMAMDKNSEYAYGQDDGQDLINSAYPMPEEPSSQTMQKQGEIPPPGREQGVETNSPGSPATNIRDDDGSSVPAEDELDKLPPIPPHHKHPPPAPSTRKMGPSSPSTTPATASTKGTAASHASPDDAETSSDFSSEADDEMRAPSDEYGAGAESDYESGAGALSDVRLAPTPGLSEQQAYDRETEEYESQVERNQEMGIPQGPTRDPVYGQTAAPGEQSSALDRESEGYADEDSLAAEGNRPNAPADAEAAMQEANDLNQAEEAELMHEQSEMAREEAEDEGYTTALDEGEDEG